jgi:V/A-type H+-transporting ATPase subunit G/H
LSVPSDKKIEELEMHQQTIAADVNTPLQLIREKELEISGRLLAAKRDADQRIADARRKAAEVVAAAESEGGAGARDRVDAILSEARERASELQAKAKEDAAVIRSEIETRKSAAVDLVVEAVSR